MLKYFLSAIIKKRVVELAKFNFLLLESDPRVISILRENFEKEFDAYLQLAKSESDLDGALGDVIDLVICRNEFVSDEGEPFAAANKLIEKCERANRKLVAVFIGEVDGEGRELRCLEERFKIEDLNQAVIEELGLTKHDLALFKLPEYLSIPVNNFFLIDKACCDVFIKIKKKQGDQFIKRIMKDDELDRETIEKYKDMGLTEFFVAKDDHVKVLTALLNQGMNRILGIKERGGSQFEVVGETYEITGHLIEALGINDQTVRMCDATIGNIKKSIEGRDKLGMMLISILRDKSCYAYKRNYLTGLFCAELVPHMGWGRGEIEKSNFEKMLFVAFFHDILIREDKLLKIHSDQEMEDLELPGIHRTQVMNHANKVATMVQAYPHAPQGVDIIIRQHHGSANGVGFPEAYSNNISPMALAFIVVENYVIEILRELDMTKKLNLNNVFDRMNKKFPLVNYKKVVSILKALSVSK